MSIYRIRGFIFNVSSWTYCISLVASNLLGLFLVYRFLKVLISDTPSVCVVFILSLQQRYSFHTEGREPTISTVVPRNANTTNPTLLRYNIY